MSPPLRLLVLEDVEADFLLLQHHLRQQGLEAQYLRAGNDAELDAALQTGWDLVLSDYILSGMDFRTALHRIQTKHPDLPIILLSGSIVEEVAVDLLHLGLSDFIPKDRPSRLVPAIRRAIAEAGSHRARRNAETALRQSESFYRQTLESIPGMVFTTRPDGYCDYQSQQWVDYTGIPMTEHLGDGWNSLLHPEDRPRAFAAWRAAVEDRAPYDLEYRVRRHDGAYEWFRVIGRPIRDGDGRIVRWFGVAMNIERLKSAEAALRRSEANLAEAQHLARFGNWSWDMRSDRIEGSAEFFAILGVAPEALAEGIAAYLRQVHPEDLPRLTAGMEQMQTAPAASEIDYRLVRPDGRVLVVRDQVVPRLDADGKLTGLFGTLQDITENKRLEQALEKRRRELEALLDTMPAMVYVKDAGMRNILVNQAYCAEAGKPLAQILGRRDRELLPPELARQCEESDRAVMESGTPFVAVEQSWLDPDGRRRWVSTSKTPFFDERGTLIGLVGVSMDIGQHKEAEIERLATLERQRDTLVREVHHRIKNHLQGVIGLLRDQASTHPEIASPIREAIGQVRSIAEVYGLQSSRDDALVRLCDLIRTAASGVIGPVPVVADRLPEAGQEVILAQAEAVPLALVLNELITNAIKHLETPDPERPVHVSLAREGHEARIEIRGGPTRLPPGFDFALGVGTGTGLGLVASLLPTQGARLRFRQEGEEVVAELRLSPPVILGPVS